MRAIPLALLALAAATAITGCATKKNFYALDGSRADGTVDMAYDFRQFETPVVDKQQAHTIARAKCGVWGYSDAEPFGGMQQKCIQQDGWGTCVAGQMVIKYQCLGNLDAPPPSSRPSAQVTTGSAPGMMTKQQWQQQQLEQLNREGLSYEEYQRRYREIVGH